MLPRMWIAQRWQTQGIAVAISLHKLSLPVRRSNCCSPNLCLFRAPPGGQTMQLRHFGTSRFWMHLLTGLIVILLGSIGSSYKAQAVITCPGFMPSRLQVGKTARVTPGEANALRSGPSLTATSIGRIPGGAVFMVVEGPTCADQTAWWKVEFNGQSGWTAEGKGSEYWLEPLPDEDATPTVNPTATPNGPTSCPGFAPLRLKTGGKGRVLPGTSIRIRSQPSTNSEILTDMTEGQQFTVLEGPVCEGDSAWWKVQYQDAVGWTAEGKGNSYWTEPVANTG